MTFLVLILTCNHVHRSFASAVSRAVGADPHRAQFQLDDKVMAKRAHRCLTGGKRYPPAPKSRQEMEEKFPKWLGETVTGDRFLLHGGHVKKANDKSAVVWSFISDNGLALMFRHKTWSIESTFMSTQHLFYHTVAVHVITEEHRCLPVMWAFTSNKLRDTYVDGIFQPLFDRLQLRDRQKVVVMNYEVGIFNFFPFN